MRKPLLIATHLLALGAGWLAFRDPEPAPRPVAAEGALSGKANRNRSADLEEGLHLLAGMRIAWQTREQYEQELASQGVPEKDFDTQIRELKEQIRKLSMDLVLPDDPAAAIKERGVSDPMVGAYFAAWLRVDPDAALKLLHSDQEFLSYAVPMLGLDIWVGEVEPEIAVAAVKDLPKLQARVATTAVKDAAANDPASLGKVLDVMEGAMQRDFLISIGLRDLPPESRGAALEFAKKNLAPREAAGVILQIANDLPDGKAARAFLKDALASGIDPKVLEHLHSFGTYTEILKKDVGPDSPMDERIAAALASDQQGGDDQSKRGRAMDGIVAEDVARWVKQSPLKEGLRTGVDDISRVWEEAIGLFPQYAREEDRARLLSSVLESTAALDPEGAIALLKKEAPPGTIAARALPAIQSGMQDDIEGSIRLAGLIPEEDLRADLKRYDSIYGSTAIDTKIDQYGDFWNEWISNQTPGLNRDLLLHHTAKYLSSRGDAKKAGELQFLIRDPAVKARPLSQ